jgi:hypothetical protein
MNKDGDL